jgi:hypothetical protein
VPIGWQPLAPWHHDAWPIKVPSLPHVPSRSTICEETGHASPSGTAIALSRASRDYPLLGHPGSCRSSAAKDSRSNRHDVFDAAASFGGYKPSGIGRDNGGYGLHRYTEVKRVTVKHKGERRRART